MAALPPEISDQKPTAERSTGPARSVTAIKTVVVPRKLTTNRAFVVSLAAVSVAVYCSDEGDVPMNAIAPGALLLHCNVKLSSKSLNDDAADARVNVIDVLLSPPPPSVAAVAKTPANVNASPSPGCSIHKECAESSATFAAASTASTVTVVAVAVVVVVVTAMLTGAEVEATAAVSVVVVSAAAVVSSASFALVVVVASAASVVVVAGTAVVVEHVSHVTGQIARIPSPSSSSTPHNPASAAQLSPSGSFLHVAVVVVVEVTTQVPHKTLQLVRVKLLSAPSPSHSATTPPVQLSGSRVPLHSSSVPAPTVVAAAAVVVVVAGGRVSPLVSAVVVDAAVASSSAVPVVVVVPATASSPSPSDPLELASVNEIVDPSPAVMFNPPPAPIASLTLLAVSSTSEVLVLLVKTITISTELEFAAAAASAAA